MNSKNVRTCGRNADIDVMKFIASIMIMLCHSWRFYAQTPDNSIPFRAASLFNMLFFMITGYFTAKHFVNNMENSPEHPGQKALKYTIKKLSTPFFILVFVLSCFTH